MEVSMMYWASLSFSIAADGTTEDKYLPVMQPGWCKFLKIWMSDNTNAVTGTLTIYDPDGHAIYSKAAIPKNGVTLEEAKTLPLHPKCKVNLTLSGVPGAGGATALARFSMVE